MNSKNNNIEHIFKEKLQELEVMPSEHLWVTISQEIASKKEQKKPFLFWYIGGGIAASLVIFTTLLVNFSANQNNNNLVINNQEEYCPEESLVHNQKNNQNTKNLNSIEPTKPSITNSMAVANNKSNTTKNTKVKSGARLIDPIKINSQENNLTTHFASAEKPKGFLNKNSNPIISNESEKNTVKKVPTSESETHTENELLALLQSEKKEEVPEKELNKRWSIQPQVTTFSYNGNGSSISDNFKNNPQDIETDLSYGMRIAYQASPKLSIRAGINNASINITTSNIGIVASENSSFSEFFTNNEVAIVNLDSGNNANGFSGDSIDLGNDGSGGENVVNSVTSGKISQQIQYFEIPLEIAYNILDKKIGIDIIGGFSTFIVNKNETTFESTNTNTSLGETSSINNTSYSSNFGFSVDYRLIDNLKLSIEPMLKIQFNSFDDTTDNQPYFIGVSSGLKWNF